jgi:hypothetical protein
MPVSFNEVANDTLNSLFGNSFISTLFNSSLLLAGVFSVIMILLVMALYPAKPNTTTRDLFKLFVWFFGVSFIVLLLHNNAVKRKYSKELEDKEDEEKTDFNAPNVWTTPRTVVMPGMQQQYNPASMLPNYTQQVQQLPPQQPVTGSSEEPLSAVGGNGNLAGPKPVQHGGNPFK